MYLSPLLGDSYNHSCWVAIKHKSINHLQWLILQETTFIIETGLLCSFSIVCIGWFSPLPSYMWILDDSFSHLKSELEQPTFYLHNFLVKGHSINISWSWWMFFTTEKDFLETGEECFYKWRRFLGDWRGMFFTTDKDFLATEEKCFSQLTKISWRLKRNVFHNWRRFLGVFTTNEDFLATEEECFYNWRRFFGVFTTDKDFLATEEECFSQLTKISWRLKRNVFTTDKDFLVLLQLTKILGDWRGMFFTTDVDFLATGEECFLQLTKISWQLKRNIFHNWWRFFICLQMLG